MPLGIRLGEGAQKESYEMAGVVDSQEEANLEEDRKPAFLLRRRPIWVVALIAVGALLLGGGIGFMSQQSTISSKSSQVSTLKKQNASLTSRINSRAAKQEADTAATNLIRAQQQQQAAAAAAAAQQRYLAAAAAAAAQRQAAANAAPTASAGCTLSPSVCQQLQYQIDNPGAPLANEPSP
jgi:cytoskeletal protein RodZ